MPADCNDEDDLLPISALQHLAFCERQCALIYVEGAWAENQRTAEGRQLHDRTHAQDVEVRAGVRIARGLRLRSLRLGLSGQADVVEFHALSALDAPLPSVVGEGEGLGVRQPFPVEYKRGKPKTDHCDEVQLCAQAMCLEEMIGLPVPEGALYYSQPRRRTPVSFTPELRAETEALATRLHELVRLQRTPPPLFGKHCKSCSLEDLCLPRTSATHSARRYLEAALQDAVREEVMP
jgi:CRISPR-associated exonuclease Cas4